MTTDQIKDALQDALQTARLVAACRVLPTETRRLARLRVRRIRRAIARIALA